MLGAGSAEDKPKDKQEQRVSNHSSFARVSQAERGDDRSKGQQLSCKSKAQLVNFSIIFMSGGREHTQHRQASCFATSSIKTKAAKAFPRPVLS